MLGRDLSVGAPTKFRPPAQKLIKKKKLSHVFVHFYQINVLNYIIRHFQHGRRLRAAVPWGCPDAQPRFLLPAAGSLFLLIFN